MIKNIQIFLFGVLLLAFASCVQHTDPILELVPEQKKQPKIIIKYAKGFEVDYETGFVKITTQSFSSNIVFKDSIYILQDSTVKLANDLKVISAGKKRIACQSSTYLAFLTQLNALNTVCGLCGTNYVNDDSIGNVLAENNVKELCLAGQVQLEALFNANPNLFLVFPFNNSQSEGYMKNGIKTLLVAEYLEETQLARLEWIKFFGLLVGEVEKANAYFSLVEKQYLALVKSSKKQDKTFIMNLPFQDNWYMPAKQSVGVQLIEDAGLSYFYSNEIGTENKLHSKEKVWNDGVSADYWIIVSQKPIGFTLADLLEEAPVYEAFLSVSKRQVIFCNTTEVDYFAQGVIEPHIVLKDLLYATGQLSNYSPQYFFLLE